MAFTVRHADRRVVDALADLLAEMDRFYGGEPESSHEVRRGQVAEALFAPVPWGYALVAMDGETVVGLATYSYHWPAVGLTRSLFLKEFYVAERVRRRGVGRALMQRLLTRRVRDRLQPCRVDGRSTESGAQDFYRTLGFEPDGSKLVYRRHSAGGRDGGSP